MAIQRELDGADHHHRVGEHIYAPIASQCSGNAKAVGKSIRDQRDICWNSPERRREVCLVCYGREDIPERPTPGEFIRLLALYVTKLRARKAGFVKSR